MELKKRLLADKKALLDRLDYINELLRELGEDVDTSAPKKAIEDDSFPKNASQFDQIIYILEKENRFLHNSEITNILLPYWNKDEKWVSRRVSALLSSIKRETKGAITNIKVNNSLKNTFWGSAKWLDELLGDEPLPKHMYNKSLVEAPKKKSIDF
ncbi:hypothetical protein ACFSQJ_18020 [Croceitalea marina]|uniref:Uncharacterized protein n=1 Tax=Croceitalea marina TaxID=1775166 RepID=A0ABW5N2K2_9FLAO